MSSTNGSRKCKIGRLLEFKDYPDLKDAPADLITLLTNRWKDCSALDGCISHNLLGLCDCKIRLIDKLEFKPIEPSVFIQNKRSIEARSVTIFINSIRGLTEDQRDLLFLRANKLRYEYKTEMMPEIKALLNTFNLERNDHEK